MDDDRDGPTSEEERRRIELSTRPTPEVMEKNEKLCRQSRAAGISVLLQIAWLCLGNPIAGLRDGNDPVAAEIEEIDSVIQAAADVAAANPEAERMKAPGTGGANE